jgi:branched-chain amino acid transport system substrate-binding protein
MQRGAEVAVDDLNSAGGVLGEEVRLIAVDDFCDPDQAVAAAQHLAGQGVVFVVGHYCSGASIPASEVYQTAGIIQISPASTNPLFTERRLANVFRVIGRDDTFGIVDGNYLADHWTDGKIAILHDGSVFGKGLADETRRQLRSRGLNEAVYQAYDPGKDDYSADVALLEAARIDVMYVGGYHTEIALLARAALDRSYRIELVSGSGVLATEEFGLIAGPAAEGTVFSSFPDPRQNPNAAALVARFQDQGFEPEGYTLLTYVAVQVWAQAAEKANSLAGPEVVQALHDHEYGTVLGAIAFDEKGDVTTQAPVWYVWRGGEYVPLE